MSRFSLIFALFLLTFGQTAHAAWVPVDYADRIEEVRRLRKEFGIADLAAARQMHAAEIRSSRPGSPLYVPHSFPKSHAEIVANFNHADFERCFEGTPWEKLLAWVSLALREQRKRVEIVRVENWKSSRCTSEGPNPYFYFLRLFDRGGREVARGTQHVSGLMGIYQKLPRPVPYPPPLGDLDTFLRSKFGRALHAEQAQYVSVDGLPYCRDLMPCIAFKSMGMLYLIDGGQLLYEIAPKAPRESVIVFRREEPRAALLRPLCATEFDAPMVSLGFEWARARLIGGRKPDRAIARAQQVGSARKRDHGGSP
jgi:hypothetical protein